MHLLTSDPRGNELPFSGKFDSKFRNKRLARIVFVCWEDTWPMAETPSASLRLFYHRSELRAIWRLFIFLSIVVMLIYASNFTVRRLLPGAANTTLFLVREVMDLLVFLFASWIMGRVEDSFSFSLPCVKNFALGDMGCLHSLRS